PSAGGRRPRRNCSYPCTSWALTAAPGRCFPPAPAAEHRSMCRPACCGCNSRSRRHPASCPRARPRGRPPILTTDPAARGCAPDPSVVRAGAWYYLATSSFDWFPTPPIYRAGGLAHWEFYGSVSAAVPEGHLHGVPDSGGIWAPALSYADGLYWLVYSIVRSV